MVGSNHLKLGHKHIACAIFVMLFASYSYFHQGGGWNQNSRFDQVRAIVENHQLEINEYFLYQISSSSGDSVKVTRLAAPKYFDINSIPGFANTFDIAVFAGKVYPNKPPGTVFLAVPAYWIIFQLESSLGIDPDAWWAQTLNFYLSTVFSVGLVTAFGGVIFYLILLRLFPSIPHWVHLATTLTYGFGTLVFPFATLMVDHGLLATISLCAFGLLLVESHEGFSSFRSSLSLFLAGTLCGLSVVVNYSAILTVACLFFYGLWIAKNRLTFIRFSSVGFAFPLLLLLWYHFVCFGHPFATANTYQFGLFQTDTMLFNMMGLPRMDIAYQLLFSSYRGLFFTSPVLLLALLGFVFTIYGGRQRSEAIFIAGVFVVQLLMNCAFNGWHAGWSFGPRYLIPILPFLCLMLAPSFHQLPRLTSGLAVVSIAVMLLATAVDPQVPTAVPNPLKDYILKLSMGHKLIMNSIQIVGPVSVNPIGVYERWGHPANFIGLEPRQWHSFNLGEFLWPGSLWSLAPLMFMIGAVFLSVVRSLLFERKDFSVIKGR
jgi:hypothetical protein